MAKFTRANIEETSELVYDFIVSYTNDHSYPPSIRDICDGVGIKSTSTVHSHLKRLEEDGRIEYESGKRRAIRIMDPEDTLPDDIGFIPVVGTVTAGVPILADQQVERILPFSKDLFSSQENLFMLKVRGDSMMDAGILDGDFCVVHQQKSADFGSIIVGLLEDEATVKRLVRKDGKAWLQPENEAYDPIPFHTPDCQVLGKVVGVVRTRV